MREPEPETLHTEQLRPFTALETLASIPLWALGLTHLGSWLLLFNLLDKTFIPGRRFDRLGKFVCRRVTDLAGIRVEQHGLGHLQPGESYVFCINHVSLLDLFVVFQSIPYFHRSFQDTAHFKIPVYGGCIRVFGQLPVNRKDKQLNHRSFTRAVEMIRQGDSFVVFPEGHRTRDGRLGRFYPGAFRLAREAGVPVVPMALKGLRNICPTGDWRILPGLVELWGATAAGPIWAVGRGGLVLRHHGGEWQAMRIGEPEEVYSDVWAATSDDVRAYGTSGALLHWDGASWTQVESNTGETLRAVWGAAIDDIWATGYNGTLIHFDGAGWTPADSGTRGDLWALTGSGSTVWAAGEAGAVLRYDPP